MPEMAYRSNSGIFANGKDSRRVLPLCPEPRALDSLTYIIGGPVGNFILFEESGTILAEWKLGIELEATGAICGRRHWSTHSRSVGAMAKKVAVIDDARDFVELLTRILEDEGYEVVPIIGSLRAMEMVKQSHPNLILLDIMMPGRSGWELLDMLSIDAATRAIPIIITTGVRAFSARLRDKIQDVLHKPFEVEELVAKVKAAIGEP